MEQIIDQFSCCFDLPRGVQQRALTPTSIHATNTLTDERMHAQHGQANSDRLVSYV